MSKNNICPNCDTRDMSVFYEVRSVPVHSCVLLPTQEEALEFPLGDIRLGFCEECGFISNTIFDPTLIDYSKVYEDQQCYSSTFNAFAQDLANRLVRKYNLYDKNILEIGCGKGDFLFLLCELGHNSGVGIDPAYVNGRIQRKASDRLAFVKDYYSERYASYKGDLVCCRHTLEHICETASFVNTVRNSIGDRLETVVFFEVPDVSRILRELAFWDIYYEHCSYFTSGSLARLFRSCGFEVIDLYKGFDDQYLLIETRPTSEALGRIHESEESIKEIEEDVKHFSTHYHDKLDNWRNRLQKIKADGTRTVVWGSGSKCVSFMTTLGVKDEIEYVIDINPHRHGKFLPCVGKEIMPPEFLRQYEPDLTIVMNPIYRNEIQQMLRSMGISSEVISVE